MPSSSFLRRRFNPFGLLLAWLAILGPLLSAPVAGSHGAAGSTPGVTEICTPQGLARIPALPSGEDTPVPAGALAHCPLCLFNHQPAVPPGSGPALELAAAVSSVTPAAIRDTPAAPLLHSPAQPRAPPSLPA